MNYTLTTIILVVILILFVIWIVYKCHKRKMHGGYTEEDINRKLLETEYNEDVLSNPEKYNADKIARNSLHKIYPDLYTPEIKFEGDGLFYTTLNADAKQMHEIPFSSTFKPDGVIYFNDIDNTDKRWGFIFEFDEDNTFHSDNKNISYVKKQLNYHKMILNNKPNNHKFIIVRITYSKSFHKSRITNVLNYINKFHKEIATKILPSGGYILYKEDRGKLKFISREILMEFVRDDIGKNENKNSKVSTIYEIVNDKAISTLTDNEMMDEIPPKLIPYKSTNKEISFPIYFETTERSNASTQTEKMEGKGLTNDYINARCIKVLSYLRKVNILEDKYKAGQGGFFRIKFGTGEYIRKEMREIYDSDPYYLSSAYKWISSDTYYDKDEFTTAYDDLLNNYILNKSLPFVNRVILLNSYIFNMISLYENWKCRESDDYRNLPDENQEMHRTDEIYSLYKVYELIDKYEKLIMPELVYRVKHPERLMSWKDIRTGYNEYIISFKPLLHISYEPTIENSNGFA